MTWNQIYFVISNGFTLLGVFLAFLLLSRIASEQRSPGNTLAWIVAMVFVPYVGIPLYLLFGGRKLKMRAKRKGKLPIVRLGTLPQEEENLTEVERILTTDRAPTATRGNKVEYLDDGVRAYEVLLEWIRGAKSTIHIGTFILGRDAVAKSIVDALAKKAAEGVEVRFLIDSLGSFGMKNYCKAIVKCGGKVGVFMPVFPFHRKWAANLRLHRKITVVDGRKAMIGGMNLADEYMGPTPDPKRWRDFSIAIEGPAVAHIHEVFAADWSFATGESIDDVLKEDYETCCPIAGRTKLQIVASGPDVPDDPFYEALLTAMSSARERIWIVTPYFIPDITLLKLLRIQAKLGRDVRIYLPFKSDAWLADTARKFATRTLSRNGAKIYLRKGPLLHSKLVLIDESCCAVGSANMDMRSLYFNYEIAAFMYDRDKINEMAEHIKVLESECVLYHPRPKKLRNWFMDQVEGLVQLVAPLL